MSVYLNLKLKDNIEPEILLKYGFNPKYDVDTGKVIEFHRTIEINRGHNEMERRHFTFKLVACEKKYLFKRFFYDAWMTGFQWGDVTKKECLELLFQFIKDDIVEIAD